MVVLSHLIQLCSRHLALVECHVTLLGCGDLTNGSDPYGLYHTFHAYKTSDFATYENLGVALALDARLPGTAFRPSVIYNPTTKLFVMWFEDRGIRASEVYG